MTSFPISPSSIDSRQFLSGQGLVDTTGTCRIELPTPPMGSYYTGSVTVYDAPIIVESRWTVYVNNFPVDVASGQSTVANLQIGHGDTLVLQSNQLQAYVGQTFHCAFVCIVSPADQTNLIVPGHDAYFSNSAIANNGRSVGSVALPSIGGPQTVDVQVTPGDNYLAVFNKGAPVLLFVQGDQSSMIIGYDVVGGFTGPAIFPVFPLIDSSYTITATPIFIPSSTITAIAYASKPDIPVVRLDQYAGQTNTPGGQILVPAPASIVFKLVGLSWNNTNGGGNVTIGTTAICWGSAAGTTEFLGVGQGLAGYVPFNPALILANSAGALPLSIFSPAATFFDVTAQVQRIQ